MQPALLIAPLADHSVPASVAPNVKSWGGNISSPTTTARRSTTSSSRRWRVGHGARRVGPRVADRATRDRLRPAPPVHPPGGRVQERGEGRARGEWRNGERTGEVWKHRRNFCPSMLLAALLSARRSAGPRARDARRVRALLISTEASPPPCRSKLCETSPRPQRDVYLDDARDASTRRSYSTSATRATRASRTTRPRRTARSRPSPRPAAAVTTPRPRSTARAA